VNGEPSVADRLRFLGRNASRWILALLLLVVAVVVGVSWTLGAFDSSAANPKNTVSAGSMSQDNSADNSAIMSATALVPGDVVDGTATIRNVGDAHGEFTLSVKHVEDDPGPQGGVLSSWLRLKVFDGDSDQAIWSGRLDGLDVGLGTWSPDESHTYRFEISFPQAGASVDNRYQQSRVTVTFEWDAVQAH
jgi:hypothetical protein